MVSYLTCSVSPTLQQYFSKTIKKLWISLHLQSLAGWLVQQASDTWLTVTGIHCIHKHLLRGQVSGTPQRGSGQEPGAPRAPTLAETRLSERSGTEWVPGRNLKGLWRQQGGSDYSCLQPEKTPQRKRPDPGRVTEQRAAGREERRRQQRRHWQ